MRIKGRITSWNDSKGYGFIETGPGGKRVFVHINSMNKHGQRPAVGQQVTFSISKDRQLRPCAVKVLRLGEEPYRKQTHIGRFIQVLLALAFLIYVGKLAMGKDTPVEVFYAYLGLSLLTFLAYAKDKSAAQKGNWRIREDTLHAFALVGGWPGAMVAQQTLRHKSSKGSFRFVFWITALANCVGFAWFFTPNGDTQIRALMETIGQLF
jgi:uncharacterized membrane protein YsdA (DUF1294 family)/cold shock CspA family protein